MFKAHSDRAKMEAKAKVFFDVCHLFFDRSVILFTGGGGLSRPRPGGGVYPSMH